MRVVSDANHSAPRALPLWWVLLTLLLMACSQPDGADSAPESAVSRAVPVRTVRVTQEDLEVTVGAIGSLTAAEEITIRPEIAGVVDAIHFREGKPVARDARLFSLESDKIRQSLAARRAALKAAEAETVNTRTILRRRRLLLAQKVIPRETFDEAQTAYKTTAAHQERLEAEIRRIQAQLDDTMIRSPIDGMATALGVEVGDFVESGQALVTIVQSDVLEIDFTVPERYANQVAEGQAVTVRTAAAEGRTFAGRDRDGKHFGSKIYPGSSSVVQAQVPDDKVDGLLDDLARFREAEVSHRHLTALVLPLEKRL